MNTNNMTENTIYNNIVLNKELIELLNTSFYNQERYAYHFNIFVLQYNNKNSLSGIIKNIRKTDNIVHIDDNLLVVEYPFIDFDDALTATEKLIAKIMNIYPDEYIKHLVVSSKDHKNSTFFIKYLLDEFFAI